MKLLKKILIITMILISITTSLTCYNIKQINAMSNNFTRSLIKVGVLYNDTPFYSFLNKNLENIQKENPNEVEFTFFNGEHNPATQIIQLDSMLKGNFDLLLINLFENKEGTLIKDFVNKAKQKNIPFILYNVIPADLDLIKNYPKSLIINSDVVQSGALQGRMIADAWKAHKKDIDKNSDNILQYIMIKGNPANIATELRTKYSISTINDAGIKTKELASESANWEEELAKDTTESLFYRFINKIEVIIANNDSMAIGAIKTLQKYGYNIGDKSKYIPVYGIDGIQEAKNLIEKGFMAGTVTQDSKAFAEALYTVGMNLVSGNDPLEGTNYKFDKTGVTILIPHQEYIKKEGQ